MGKALAIIGATSALAMLGACAVRASGPNEFNVVTKAPLTVPPDYNLRPPPVGENRPPEADPELINRALTFGQQIGLTASISEQVLIARADAIAVSPSIRSVLDYEESNILRKSGAVSDRVVSWSGTEEERATAASDSATGGEEVVIEQSSGPRIKLPGT